MLLHVGCVRDVNLGPGDAGDGGRSDAEVARDTAPEVEPLGPECPTDVPASGTSCSIVNLRCEYGSSEVPECNTIAYCELKPLRFTLTPPAEGCPMSPPTNAGYCPASYSEVVTGGACTMGQACHYDDGECDCGLTQPASSGWTCVKQTAGCPPSPPRFGSACPEGFPEGGQCYYYACEPTGASAFCQGGIWNGGSGGCVGIANHGADGGD
jgi:hypothetical protein